MGLLLNRLTIHTVDYLRKRPFVVVALGCLPVHRLDWCRKKHKYLRNCLLPGHATLITLHTNGKQDTLESHISYLCMRDRWMFLEKHSIPRASFSASWSRWLIYFFTMATNEPPSPLSLLSASLSLQRQSLQ